MILSVVSLGHKLEQFIFHYRSLVILITHNFLLFIVFFISSVLVTLRCFHFFISEKCENLNENKSFNNEESRKMKNCLHSITVGTVLYLRFLGIETSVFVVCRTKTRHCIKS